MVVAPAQHAHTIGVERQLQLGCERRQRVVVTRHGARERRERFRVRARLRGLERSSGRLRDEETHDCGDRDEDHEREEVFRLRDRPRMYWWREVPVGEQETFDRGNERRRKSSQRGDDHDDEQEREKVARQPKVRAELHE